jgi:hypothetical protein
MSIDNNGGMKRKEPTSFHGLGILSAPVSSGFAGIFEYISMATLAINDITSRSFQHFLILFGVFCFNGINMILECSLRFFVSIG